MEQKPFVQSRLRRPSNALLSRGVLLAVAACLLVSFGLVSARAENAAPPLAVGSEIDFPPYAIVDAEGHASGFSVELLEAVAQAMGLKIQVRAGPWPDVLGAFKAGKLDLLPLVALSAKRADMATYSKPHTVAYDCFFVRRGGRPPSSLAEARDKAVVVMSSDAAHEALVQTGLPVRIVETKTIPEAMRLLAAGRHDAVLVPKLLGHLVLRDLKLEGVIEAGPPIPDYRRQFAFAVQRGNTELRDKLDQGIAIIRATGRYDALYKKWFGGIEDHRFPWYAVLWGSCSVILLVILASGWVVSLRRQMALTKSECKLAEALEFNRSILKTSSIGILTYDGEGQCTFANQAAADIVGTGVAELLSQNYHQIESWKAAGIYDAAQRAVDAGAERYLEARITTTFGRDVWLSLRFSPFRAGNESHLLVFSQDITERKQAEEALRDSERRFKSYFNLPVVGMAITSLEKGWLEVNDRLCSLLGYPREELLRMTWAALTHPEDLPADVEHFNRVLDGEMDGYVLDKRFVRKDKTTIWANLAVQCVRGPGGAVEYFAAVVQDITERKQGDIALRSSLERVTFAERAAHVGFWDWDLPAGQLNWSPEFYRLFGLDPSEGASFDAWRRALHPDDREGAEATIERAIAARTPVQNEYRILRPDGERWISASGTTVYDEGGRPLRMSGICTDVTAQKSAEAEREKLEASLRQAQKMEAIGTLAGGIAHDFNNILTPIMAHGELALMQLSEDDPVREDISDLLAAAERAAALVRQILAASRKEDGAAPVAVNVGGLVREMAKFLRATIPSTIDVRVDVAPDCGPVLVEPSRLHQVVLNLCTNASYAMAEKGGVLTVSLAREETGKGGKGRVRLAVTDTGPGIAPEVQNRIFEPYFTTKPVGKGSGLGLAVVHGIVTKLGGEIRVQSTQGEGTTFEVLLPEAAGAEPQRDDARHEIPRGSGQHVLVADDEAQVRLILQKLLEALGYRVTACGSGVEALEAFGADPRAFDAVLTDYTMPGMTGLDLAGKLLALRPDLPVVLGTGYAEAVDARVAAGRGLRGLVMKPYDRRTLGEALGKALGRPV